MERNDPIPAPARHITRIDGDSAECIKYHVFGVFCQKRVLYELHGIFPQGGKTAPNAAAQFFLAGAMYLFPVQSRSLAILCKVHLFSRREINGGKNHAVFMRERDHGGKKRNAAGEIQRAIHGVNDPNIIAAFVYTSAFLGNNSVFRILLPDGGRDDFVRQKVCLGHAIPCVIGFHVLHALLAEQLHRCVARLFSNLLDEFVHRRVSCESHIKEALYMFLAILSRENLLGPKSDTASADTASTKSRTPMSL